MGGLSGYVEGWAPEPLSTADPLAPETAQRLAATLDLDEQFVAGDALPPLWQWVYFTEWPVTGELGPDGHPLAGHFLPPIPHRRRMFAGGRLTMTSPLLLGRPAERQSAVTAIRVKSGRTGELLFVTVRQEYHQDGELRLAEEQDVVYRSDAGAATSFTRDTAPLPEPSAPWWSRPKTDPALLFRFSALTANAHRIHYDEHYTTSVEGFPALVVHGPLLAVYLAELVRAQQKTVRAFEFRLTKPVFVGDPFDVQGTPDGNAVSLAVVSGDGSVHASATAAIG
ncbi:MaoC family dehydratase N-terminal domain-containing protein [soil metagenome]